jgi:putative ABC transport system permease protein
MWTMTRLGFQEAAVRWRITFVMALAVSVSLISFLIIFGYKKGLETRYANLAEDFLIVQENGSMGEFYGSRISAGVGNELAAAGVGLVVPSIHTIVGTSPQDAVLLRGIDLDSYAKVETFKMIAGRPLQKGDPPRLTMIGTRLADERSAYPGGNILIRGRDFKVVGIFSIGTYADYEAWISLEDAQTRLGWGSDVSVFVIPTGGKLKAGDSLPGGLSVVQKGETGVNLVKEWQPMFDLLSVVASTLGIAAAAALANLLWRLAWLRRREIAILQSIGFGKSALIGYLLAQGICIALPGFIFGLLGALLLGEVTRLQTAGLSIYAVYDASLFGWSFLVACLITAAGSALPAWWLARLNLADLLRVE